jgi:membrane associated rhomboid family serine protease
MLEIVVMIGVIRWYHRTAKAIGRNGLLWGLMGAASYYVPIVVCGQFIFPTILAPYIDYDNQTEFYIGAVLANVAIGIVCCFALMTVLKATARRFHRENNIVKVN